MPEYILLGCYEQINQDFHVIKGIDRLELYTFLQNSKWSLNISMSPLFFKTGHIPKLRGPTDSPSSKIILKMEKVES